MNPHLFFSLLDSDPDPNAQNRQKLPNNHLEKVLSILFWDNYGHCLAASFIQLIEILLEKISCFCIHFTKPL